MATMTISLPEPMREFVEAEVSRGQYSSASELFREMVRDRQKRKAQEKLENLLLEGVESGERIEASREYIEERRRRLVDKLNKFEG